MMLLHRWCCQQTWGRQSHPAIKCTLKKQCVLKAQHFPFNYGQFQSFISIDFLHAYGITKAPYMKWCFYYEQHNWNACTLTNVVQTQIKLKHFDLKTPCTYIAWSNCSTTSSPHTDHGRSLKAGSPDAAALSIRNDRDTGSLKGYRESTTS